MPPLLRLAVLLVPLAPACELTAPAPPPDPVPAVEPASGPGPERVALSDELARAYDVLAATRRFTDAAIGIGGDTPREVIAWRLLDRAERRDALFAELFERGGRGTKLYAAAGLWYSGEAAFEPARRELACLGGTVEFQSGCVAMTDHPVLVLLDAGERVGVRLASRQDSVRAWMERHTERRGVRYDLVGGGFANLFRADGGWGEVRDERLEAGSD